MRTRLFTGWIPSWHDIGHSDVRIVTSRIAVFLLLLGSIALLSWSHFTSKGIDDKWISRVNQLKQIGFALDEYVRVHGELPPKAVSSNAAPGIVSWRCLLADFVSEQANSVGRRRASDGPAPDLFRRIPSDIRDRSSVFMAQWGPSAESSPKNDKRSAQILVIAVADQDAVEWDSANDFRLADIVSRQSAVALAAESRVANMPYAMLALLGSGEVVEMNLTVNASRSVK